VEARTHFRGESRDQASNIADYYGVDSRYGSSGDFVEFIHEARERSLMQTVTV